MSSWADIKIDGFVIDEFTHLGWHTWYFRHSERVREITNKSDNADLSGTSNFIGYRTSAATIRKRLELDGYTFSALQLDFDESLERYINELQNVLKLYQDDLSKNGNHLLKNDIAVKTIQVQSRMINSIRSTTVDDWIALLPAARYEREKNKLGRPHLYGETEWINCDSNSVLLSAMLSSPLTLTESYFTADFNFPVSNPDFFALALLKTVPDDAVCELDLTELIASGYLDDFTDLAEIKSSETLPCKACHESLMELEVLAAVEPRNTMLQRMCYASMVTAMEAYLGDIIKREVMTRPSLMERFVASYSEYSELKFTLSQIHSQLRKLHTRVRDTLDGIAFHNLAKARKIFMDVLLIEFEANAFGLLCKAVNIRNDIVHRNGKDKKGNMVNVSMNDVQELRSCIMKFISHIDFQVLDGMAKACSED